MFVHLSEYLSWTIFSKKKYANNRFREIQQLPYRKKTTTSAMEMKEPANKSHTRYSRWILNENKEKTRIATTTTTRTKATPNTGKWVKKKCMHNRSCRKSINLDWSVACVCCILSTPTSHLYTETLFTLLYWERVEKWKKRNKPLSEHEKCEYKYIQICEILKWAFHTLNDGRKFLSF